MTANFRAVLQTTFFFLRSCQLLFRRNFVHFRRNFIFPVFFWKSSFVQNFLSLPFTAITIHYQSSPYITLHYPELPCITLHYSALSCITLHYHTLHYPALPCITLHYPALLCITLHYPSLPFVTLHYPAYRTLPCITLHYPAYYPTLPCITLHYPALPCFTLHYHSLPSSQLLFRRNFVHFCHIFIFQLFSGSPFSSHFHFSSFSLEVKFSQNNHSPFITISLHYHLLPLPFITITLHYH